MYSGQKGSFTEAGREMLINRTLGSIICDNTEITHVPGNVFNLMGSDHFTSCDDVPKIDVATLIDFEAVAGSDGTNGPPGPPGPNGPPGPPSPGPHDPMGTLQSEMGDKFPFGN